MRSGGGAALSSVGHHAEILRGGPEAWNAWRKKRPSTIPHLTGVVLAASERELGGTRGVPINLKSARLQEAVFRFATLSAANLQAADLAHADLVHARLTQANLREAALQSAALDHADFSGAILRNADLRGASLRFATLTGADLQGADLSGADLAHARLARTKLAGAKLRGAVLDYADFAGADLSQADLSGARLHNVRNLSTPQLEEALGDAATILPSHLRGCVPWSAVGDEPEVPLLDPAEFWLLQARRDLRGRTFYSGAPMPFMHRLTRSGTALHAGAIPGYPASHGCVRLPYSFAPKLFEMTSVGQNVVVTRGRPVPTPIEHPNLFELPPPKPQVAMAASVAVPRLLSDAVAVAAKSEVEDRAVAAFRSDAPLRMLVTRRTAHDRVMAVQYMLADLGYLARQNFIGNLGPATGSAIRAFQKANGFPVTGAFTDELASQVYRAAGKTEPPEGHLFVRQGFKRVFDLPISFRDPAVPLGTHVFSVVKRGGGEAKPEWMAVSLEGGDAASVLDRIDIPDDVRRSIAPRLTPGSTLIVADKSEYSAILPEGDDFLVSTAEQAAAEDAKVEQASAGPDAVAPAKAKVAKKRPARAAPVARTRSYDVPRREIRRRYISRPSSFGMPYFFGR